MKMGNRVQGAIVGAGTALLLGQIPPFTILPEEKITLPIAAGLGFLFGTSWIKKLKNELF